MNNNYFFIDGSALTAQIRQLQRQNAMFKSRKLCPRKFIEHFIRSLRQLHGGSYKRAVFYFPKGDEVAIEDFILVPDHAVPGEIEDMHFKFCGQKLKKAADFAQFVEEKVPPKYHDRFQKSEKGVDTEMCCDALRLATTGRLERLFLLTNDSDLIPLCRTLKEFGANVSILHLSRATPPNGELLREADTYSVVDESKLSAMFLPEPVNSQDGAGENSTPIIDLEPTAEGADSEKPDSEPADTGAPEEGGAAPDSSGTTDYPGTGEGPKGEAS